MRFRHVLAILLCAMPASVRAQQQPQLGADAIRVFLDCSYFCDDQFTRTEINYVNWVRDKTDAQVHILVSQLGTGGGGSQYTLTFGGRKEFAGRVDTLRYTANTTDSEDAVRRGLVRTMKFGLVPFIATTAGASRLQISWAADTPEHKDAAAKPAHDPWDFWVFTLSVGSNFNGEKSISDKSFRGNVSANRTTDAFKIRVGFNGNYNDSHYTFQQVPDVGAPYDTTVVSIRRSNSLNVLAVKSLGTHWSAGLSGYANSATRENIDLGINGGPALEYNVWPYSQATRRSLAFRYQPGFRSYNYHELTIYKKLAETHPTHLLTGELNLRQPFGSITLETNFSQYLHNTAFYNASVFTSADVKLFKGFSFNFYGSYERVHDQITLAASDPTQADVLLQQRQLATGYQYWGGFGIRYSFGSIFNNVVNPRFGEGGGGMIIMN
jgi:hypothetical protein